MDKAGSSSQESKVIKVNVKAKDTFFKKVYDSTERRKRLAAFLLNVDVEDCRIQNVEPVLFGNKENDLAFVCDDTIYCMMEEQSSICVNMPYRILEYITTALRDTVSTETALYGRSLVKFPLPKLYVVNVGLEETEGRLPESVQYDMRLSDSFYHAEDKTGKQIHSDLEVIVHVYDFRMTYEEALTYIEEDVVPKRVDAYETELKDYALFANSLRYVQRSAKTNENTQAKNVELETGKERKHRKAKNAKDEVELFALLLSRNIFFDLLSDKGVCDLTAAQFSREDIFKAQGSAEMEEKKNKEIQEIVDKKDKEIDAKDKELDAKDKELVAKNEEIRRLREELAKRGMVE